MPNAAIDILSFRKLTPRERLKSSALRAARAVTTPLRRAYYVDQPAWSRRVAQLPGVLRVRLGLADDEAVGSRKIELGGGPYPLPGYIHVDSDWRAQHLEAVAKGRSLPFPDDFADEIIAIHLLEHIHPNELDAVLKEWRRVLKPGGLLQVHVPDAKALAERFLAAKPMEKWKFVSATLGMYSAPDAREPKDIVTRADHQLLLDWPLLERILRDADFDGVENVSTTVRDRHTVGWAPVMDQISLVARAYVPR